MSSICCIGHLTRDRICTPASVVEMTGGVAYYFSHALACLPGVDYTLITKVSPSERAAVDLLRERGVAVRYIPSSATVFFENSYGTDPDVRTQRVLSVADPFTEDDVSAVAADIYHLGTLLPTDFPLSVAAALHRRGRVSLDAQGFLRTVVDGAVQPCSWDEKATFLQYVDIIKVNETELLALTGTDDIAAGCRAIAALGPREVVATLGSHGSQILYDGVLTAIPAYAPSSVVDATGCGDTFMAGYLYCRAQGLSPLQSGRFAAAMCTVKLAVHGPFSGTIAAVRGVLGEE